MASAFGTKREGEIEIDGGKIRRVRAKHPGNNYWFE